MDKFLIVCFVLFLSCKQKKQSELAEPPCVIIKLESNYVFWGYNYEAELILNCDRPDSINQIGLYAICEKFTDSLKTEEDTKERLDFYYNKGRIYCKYFAVVSGKNIFHGKLSIKTSNGERITHSFQEIFYASAPYAVISATSDKFLLLGKENKVDVVAPGIPSEELIVTATNAELTKKLNEMLISYIIVPKNKNDVEVSISTRNRNTSIPLGTWRMKVIDNYPE